MIYITYVKVHRYGGRSGFAAAEEFCGKNYSCSVVDEEDLEVSCNRRVIGIAPGRGSWLVKDLQGKITIWEDRDFEKCFRKYYKDEE